MTCQKAQGFLGTVAVSVGQQVDARKTPYGPAEVLRLLEGIEQLIVIGRGQKVQRWDLRQPTVSMDELVSQVLGPTGNLRAPTLRIGNTLIVGYHEATYREVLGV
ncbi:MAG: ArsC family (seleno)protein [Gemmataceae bacterium]|nr:ArsC family (seleno)protein [Gemmataceae bacterium]MCS7269615.1 ArsC family (seleno)protein [Gemmataceae bacterium]MDW8243832.1 ArsC family (seleno)protein [Thermogemmata sp.]